MTQYPDTEAYMVNFHGGSFGSFITVLILLLLDIVKEDQDIKFSTYGNAHDLARQRLANHNKTDTTDMRYHQVYDTVGPVDPLSPLVMSSHKFPVWDDLFYYYPKCKNIIVTHNYSDLPRLSGNLFFKTLVDDYYNEEELNGKTIWEEFKMRRSNTALFKNNNIETPLDLPQSDIKMLLSRFISSTSNTFRDKNTIDRPNVFYLPMSDIIHNKNKTLKMLEQITNRKVTPLIIETYNKFLLAQENLVKTKMPWVTV
jgi:hypothetical protein